MSYTTIDRNSPSFYLFPINTNRTSWKPIGLPIILIVPRAKTIDGDAIENGGINSLRIYIENVQQNAYVAGQDHILKDGTQLKYPAQELYSLHLSSLEIIESFIRLDTCDFKKSDGTAVSYNNATEGDTFNYITGTGVHSTLPYYPDAYYYDLSSFNITTEELQHSIYNLVYEVGYYARVVSSFSGDTNFICVGNNKVLGTFRFGFNHPGDVIQEMYRYTPVPYLTNDKKSEDSTLEFYRPFSDIINDIYDEQTLLESINWVDKAPLEMVPYMAYLLGWEIPYFPQTKGAKSLDAIRRAIIKSTAYFQQLKGSRKAVKEIFELFGLDIVVENLWWSTDGQMLIRPNQDMPEKYIDQTIRAVETYQTDILASDIIPTSASSGPNFLLFSEKLTNAAWTKNNVSVVSSSFVLPEGTVQADLITFNGSADAANISQTPGVGNGHDSYTWSGYLRTSDGSTQTLYITWGGNKGFVPITINGNWQRYTALITPYFEDEVALGNLPGVLNIPQGVSIFASQFQINPGNTAANYLKTTALPASGNIPNGISPIYDLGNNLIGSFYESTSNLLFLPQQLGIINLDETILGVTEVTLEAVILNDDTSEQYIALKEEIDNAISNPATYAETHNIIVGPSSNILSNQTLDTILTNARSRSKLLIGGSTGSIIDRQDYGVKPALSNSANFDRQNNKITFSVNGILEADEHLFAWVTYKRLNVIIPTELKELQSNRFDIQILNRDLTGQTDPKTILFSLDFLNRVKAFHSLLYLIRTSVNMNEDYEVTDMKVGGTSIQRYDNTDLGRLQVPPAILPNLSDGVCQSPEDLGFKTADIQIRLVKFQALLEEHLASYNLDNRPDTVSNYSRIAPLVRDADNAGSNYKTGAYASYGQDIITPDNRLESINFEVLHPSANANTQLSGSVRADVISDTHDVVPGQASNLSTNRDAKDFGSFVKEQRAKATSVRFPLDGSSDFAFKGRVDDSLLYRTSQENQETYNNSRGPLFMGSGCYYTYPSISRIISPRKAYTGNAPADHVVFYNNNKIYDLNDPSLLNRKFKAYDKAGEDTLHYHDGKTKFNRSQQSHQALDRPSLGIMKKDLGIPGAHLPSMAFLYADYTSNEYDFRPWDDHVSCANEKGSCGTPDTFLNAALIQGTDGDEYLSFDIRSYTIEGNNISEEIFGLGDSQDQGNTNSIHTINIASTSSPYVTLDNVDIYSSSTVISNISTPLFSTAANYGTGYHDVLDGYASSIGAYTYTKNFTDSYDDVLTALGRPVETGLNIILYYKCNSHVLDSKQGYRLDAGTLLVQNGLLVDSDYSNMNFYLKDGEYDFDADRVDNDVRMALNEIVGAGLYRLDGQLDNLAALI